MWKCTCRTNVLLKDLFILLHNERRNMNKRYVKRVTQSSRDKGGNETEVIAKLCVAV